MTFITNRALPAVLAFALLVPAVVFGHGMSEADKLAIVAGGNLRYLSLGATHMLSGYDHQLVCLGHAVAEHHRRDQ